MEKTLAVLLIVLACSVGFLAGAVLLPIEKEVVVEKVVDNLVEVEVEKLVEVEVEKDFNTYKDYAVELCFDEFADTKTLDKYQELEVLKISDDWAITFDGNTTITIDSIRFRRFDTLTNERTTWTKSCSVFLEDEEDPVITLA